MEKSSFNKYFENPDVKYYDPKIIITIIEDLLNKNYADVRNYIDNKAYIHVTEEQIKNYLDKIFEEENPELKRKIENRKNKKIKKDNDWKWHKITEKDIEESAQHLEEQLIAQRYTYEPYTLDYFYKYISILGTKLRSLLYIVEKLVNKEWYDIISLTAKYDIQLDNEGNILKDDIIRIVPPIIYNYNKLHEKTNEANNLSTYLNFKISRHSINRSGCSESEMYPTPTIQVNNLYYDCIPGNISLSQKQKKLLREQERKNMGIITKNLLDW